MHRRKFAIGLAIIPAVAGIAAMAAVASAEGMTIEVEFRELVARMNGWRSPERQKIAASHRELNKIPEAKSTPFDVWAQWASSVDDQVEKLLKLLRDGKGVSGAAGLDAKFREMVGGMDGWREIRRTTALSETHGIWAHWEQTVDDRVEEVLKLLRSSEGVRV